MESACREGFESGNACWGYIELIKHRLNELGDELASISTNGVRSKRALLDIVGNLASDLFGVLGSRFKNEYETNIMGLMSNDEHLASLLRNQTNVVEKTMNLLKLTQG